MLPRIRGFLYPRRRAAAVIPVLVLGVLLFAPGPALFAQSEASAPHPDSAAQTGPWVPPPSEYWHDAVDVARGPFTLSPAGRWRALGATALLVGTAATLDVPAFEGLSTRSAEAPSEGARDLTDPLARPGEWYDRRNANRLTLGVVGGLAASGLVLQNRAVTRTSVQTLEAVIFTEAVNGFLKSALNRDRPYVGAEPAPFAYDIGGFKGEHAALSMPSGHAARVFALASVLSASAGRWYVSAPLYAGAASVGLERVRSGDHWLTDVLVGAAIGELIGRSVAGAPSAKPSSGSGAADGSVQYRPVVSMQSVGVAVQF